MLCKERSHHTAGFGRGPGHDSRSTAGSAVSGEQLATDLKGHKGVDDACVPDLLIAVRISNHPTKQFDKTNRIWRVGKLYWYGITEESY
jgi:hypothetical protein